MNRSFLISTWVVWITLAGLVSLAGADEQAAAKAANETLRVDVNRADAKELAKLPGIGEQVAKRIIAYREENGPFEKLEELMNVRGIGEKTFLKLEPHLTLGGEREKRKK
jgi:competence protein ComEA